MFDIFIAFLIGSLFFVFRECRQGQKKGHASYNGLDAVLRQLPQTFALGRVGACGDLDAARAVKELNEEVLLRSALKK